MRRIMVVVLALALCLALLLALARSSTSQAALPAGPGARVTQVDSSNYPDVTLYVGVADTAGQPVGGLSAADFALTEDGSPVTIDAFAGGGGAVASALVIDHSGSMAERDKIGGARDAAQAFVDQMRPADRTALITFNSDAETLAPFTADQQSLAQAIRRIRPNGGTALYDSLIAGVDALANAHGRRALLLLTDGQDCRESATCAASYGSSHTLDQAIAYANQHAQPVYVIGVGDRGSDMRDGIDEPVLERIARETGGEYFYTPDGAQLAGLYRKLAADIQQEYALTYRSPRPFYDGTRRDIGVSVGGAPAASGAYVEQHLINLHSEPLVGALLLLPLLGALWLPGALRRRAGGPAPLPAPAAAATLPGIEVLPGDAPHCSSCDAPLLRAGARFCAECGMAQAPEPAPARRSFCDQCGRPARVGASFCAGCGATTPGVLKVQKLEG